MLPAGGQVVFAMAAPILASATGSLVNTATVSAGAGVTDSVPADNSSTDTDLLVPSADLSLVKSVDDATVEINDPMQFTLVVTNNGPSVASSLTVIDLLPAGLVVTSASGAGWACTPTPTTVTCTLPTLLPGASATIVLDANAPSVAGAFVNGATVQAPTADGVIANNTGTVPFAVIVLEPPIVVQVSTLEGTDDRVLEDLETETGQVSELDVVFSEEMADPVGDTDPNDVSNPASYRMLEAGRDGIFATSVCGPALGDDLSIAIDSVLYDSGDLTATIQLNGGAALTDGLYKLSVCGSALEDLDGNPLDGDDDGTPGDDFERYFRIRIRNAIEYPFFDFSTDLNNWTQTAGGPLDIVRDGIDADGFAFSGSARLQNVSGTSNLSLEQCLLLPPTPPFLLSGEARTTAGLGSPVAVSGRADYILGACATPTVLSTSLTNPIVGDTGGAWKRFSAPLGAPPPGATAIRVRFAASSSPGDAFDARLDNLSLVPALFMDGFETGDSSAWSATVP